MLAADRDHQKEVELHTTKTDRSGEQHGEAQVAGRKDSGLEEQTAAPVAVEAQVDHHRDSASVELGFAHHLGLDHSSNKGRMEVRQLGELGRQTG